jgi:Fe-S cluster biogenesis protein NfuA
MPDEDQLRGAGDRIAALLGELASAGPAVGGQAEELVQLLTRLYGAGLERILTVLYDAGPAAAPWVDRLAEDELVASLLVLHDLHPLDLEARVARALDQVRLYLGSHGGGVELLGVADGVVRLRLAGSCDGCPSSAVTMKLAIERAIEEAAPEIAGIEVEGVAPEPGPAAAGGNGHGNGGLVQIGQGRGVPRPAPALAAAPREHAAEHADKRCELCGTPIPPEHRHLVDLETRSLLCACRPCGLLFTREGAAGGKYRTVPERYLPARDLVLTEAQWESLQIPVGIAFFFHNSALGRAAAFYPGPAGATESLLPLGTWEELARANPLLAGLEPDVEALLVHRRAAELECYVVPIDACYELVGRIRRRWKGFEGGEEAWREIEGFFAELRARSGEAPSAESVPAPPSAASPDAASEPCPS